MSSDFVHLHLHTQYSLLDGANRTKDLIEHVLKSGMGAVAVTDHGNMFGAFDIQMEAVKKGIKPILGVEAYIAPGSRHDRETVKTVEAKPIETKPVEAKAPEPKPAREAKVAAADAEPEAARTDSAPAVTKPAAKDAPSSKPAEPVVATAPVPVPPQHCGPDQPALPCVQKADFCY